MTHPAVLLQMTDQDLVACSLQGDRQAFGELVERYREPVVGVVVHMIGDRQLAEDAAQEAFIRSWQRLRSYKPSYPFRNWIYRIAIHVALDNIRSERKEVRLDDLNLRSSLPDPEVELETKERIASVRKAMLALPPASRAVLVLREYQGLSYQEIAGVLDIPIGTVMSRLNYARNHLRRSLECYLEMRNE